MTVQPLYQRMLHLGFDTVQSRITRLFSRAVLSSSGFTMLTGSSEKDTADWIQDLQRKWLTQQSKSTLTLLKILCFHSCASRSSTRTLFTHYSAKRNMNFYSF